MAAVEKVGGKPLKYPHQPGHPPPKSPPAMMRSALEGRCHWRHWSAASARGVSSRRMPSDGTLLPGTRRSRARSTSASSAWRASRPSGPSPPTTRGSTGKPAQPKILYENAGTFQRACHLLNSFYLNFSLNDIFITFQLGLLGNSCTIYQNKSQLIVYPPNIVN